MKYLLTLLGFAMMIGLSAQDKSKDLAYMVVKSSTVCDMCKETLETELPFVKGVHKVAVDLNTSEIAVDYNPKKIDKQGVRLAISKLGYSADDVPADQKAFAKLPACCQKEGCGQKKEAKNEHEDMHHHGDDHDHDDTDGN